MKVYRFNAELRIPYAQLTMLPRGDVAWGQVQVVVVGVDTRGQPVRAHAPEGADRARGRQARGGAAARLLRVPLHPRARGRRRPLRIAVNDVLAHTTSTVFADLKL